MHCARLSMRHRPEALKKTNVKFNDSIEEHVFCNGDVEGCFRMAARVSGPSQGSRAPLSPVLPLGTTYLKLTPRNNQDNESTRQSLPSFETQNDRNEIGRAMHYSAHGSITLDLGGAGQAGPLWPSPGERLKSKIDQIWPQQPCPLPLFKCTNVLCQTPAT